MRRLTWRDETNENVIPFVPDRGGARKGPAKAGAAERVLSHDWSLTPLGPMDDWEHGRRVLVDVILSSPLPTIGLWGRELIQLYNDAAAELPGAGEQLSFGASALDVWPRTWPRGEALVRAATGEAQTFAHIPELATLAYTPVRTRHDPLPVVLVHAVPLPPRRTQPDPHAEQRTRNTLALLRSIVARSAPLASDVEEYGIHLLGRIEAIARVQIAASVATDGIDIAALVAEELQAVGAHEGGIVSIGGPPFRLAIRAAEKIGLAVHELATNAVKFGALAYEGGRVDISWRIEDEREPALVIEWVERGVPGVIFRERDGFGGQLIERALPYELSATTVLAFEPGGVRCILRLPVSKVRNGA